MKFAPALFAAESDWLDRLRAEALRDLEILKARLDDIAGLPFEQRGRALNSILVQADGAYRQIERIELLRGWGSLEVIRAKSPHWKLRQTIATAAAELRLAA